MIYLDTSAFLKTMFDEPQSPAIRTYRSAGPTLRDGPASPGAGQRRPGTSSTLQASPVRSSTG